MELALGITGASGAQYAKRLLEVLENVDNIETVHCVISDAGRIVWRDEIGGNFDAFISTIGKAQIYDIDDFYSPLASGSSFPDSMIVLPCSMSTLSKVANGISDNLLVRAADVALKERKKLILAIREAPYNLIHIKNMEKVTLAGATIYPLSPSFYLGENSLQNIFDTLIGRILNYAGITNPFFYKWGKK